MPVRNGVDGWNNATVIGLGAMGGGIALALLDAPAVATVVGYDCDPTLAKAFFNDSVVAHKQRQPHGPTCLRDAISDETDFVFLVLLNEAQCQTVCFGGDNNKNDSDNNTDNLLSLVPEQCCIVCCATVSAQWARQAQQQFQNYNTNTNTNNNNNKQKKKTIHFVDCPTSGGPSRARAGDLTLLVSGDDASLHRVLGQWPLPTPDNNSGGGILHALARPNELHVIQSQTTTELDDDNNSKISRSSVAGLASTVKMVHQLLAGVHICAAAEALALAAAANLDIAQVVRIVQGAAGASWMFLDRGPRMIRPAVAAAAALPNDSKYDEQQLPPVKSMLDIFVKDLDIVHAEAKRLRAPIPLASMALQQFISGQSLGLGRQDDSQVVQVYENVTGKLVQYNNSNDNNRSSNAIGSTTTDAQSQNNPQPIVENSENVWIMQDGTMEDIVEVGMEPRHRVVLHNEYIRALRVSFPPNDTTLAHRHSEDSLYFFLVERPPEEKSAVTLVGTATVSSEKKPLNVLNHVQGQAPACDCMDFGEVRYGTHKTDQPLVHKITNLSSVTMLCIDAEILKQPPVTAVIPLLADKHELIKTRGKCRVYQLTLEPGESVTVTYPFFHCTVVLLAGLIAKETGAAIRWTEKSEKGDVAWKEPVVDLKKTNVGTTRFIEFIAEWR